MVRRGGVRGWLGVWSPRTGPCLRGVAVVLTALLVGHGADGAAVAQMDEVQPTVRKPFAMVRALDKITARTQVLPIRVGDAARFGTLAVQVRDCRSTRPEQRPEDAIFLEIVDTPPGEPAREVYAGWMFSSSPAVAAMDHAVYDIWLVTCSDEPITGPEDFGREPRYSLPGNPPLPPGLPDPRRD